MTANEGFVTDYAVYITVALLFISVSHCFYYVQCLFIIFYTL